MHAYYTFHCLMQISIHASLRNTYMYILIKNFLYLYMCKKVFLEFVKKYYYFIISKIVLKGSPKWGECIFSNENPKSLQGPQVGPGPQPIKAHFICMTPLCVVSKKVQNFWFEPPLYKKLATALGILYH